ncbi:hypothetical protein MXB_2291 [Myxobolus squamalis]|nr:hypothetical protein MXB_2291 [Myxobolus squamalis]
MSQILKDKHIFDKICAKYPELKNELCETETPFILLLSFGLLNNIDSNRVKELFDDLYNYLDVYFFPNATCSILYVNEIDKLDTIIEFIKNKGKRKLNIKYLKTDLILKKIKQRWLDSYNKFGSNIIHENSSISDLLNYFSNLIGSKFSFIFICRIPTHILSIFEKNGVQFNENHKIYVKMHSSG